MKIPVYTRAFALAGFLASASSVSVLTVAACTQNTAPAATQVQQYSSLVASGVAAVSASVLATPGLSAVTAAQITAATQAVQTANAAIQAGSATASNAAVIQSAVEALAPILLGLLPGGSAAAMAISAAVALLPVIMAEVGAPKPAAMAMTGPEMSSTEAVLVLKGYVAK